jgi:hypothetical protein
MDIPFVSLLRSVTAAHISHPNALTINDSPLYECKSNKVEHIARLDRLVI